MVDEMAFPRKILTLPSGRKLSISSTPAADSTKDNPQNSPVKLAEGGVVSAEERRDRLRSAERIAKAIREHAEEFNLSFEEALQDVINT